MRLQVWMRELRHGGQGDLQISPGGAARQSKDLKARPDGFTSPLCNAASAIPPAGYRGWRRPATSCPTAWRRSYNTWFSRRSEAVRLYAGEDWPRPYVEGVPQHVLRLWPSAAQPGGCQACGHDELVAVFRTTGTRSRTRGNVAMTCHDSTCPACGQRDRQVLLGPAMPPWAPRWWRRAGPVLSMMTRN